MKKIIQIIIAFISTLAMVCAPIPQNVIASASELSNTTVTVGDSFCWMDGSTNITDYLYVAPNESITLTVPDFYIPEEAYDYTIYWSKSIYNPEWGGYNGVQSPVDDEHGDQIITDPITINCSYHVRIDDSFGNCLYYYFNIYADSGLAWSDGTTESGWTGKTAALDQIVTLDVPAYLYDYDQSELSVEWSKSEYDPETGDPTGYYVVENETDWQYSFVADKRMDVQCKLMDKYGNYIFWYFGIEIDTGLAWVDGVDSNSNYDVAPGEPVTLNVPDYNCNSGVTVHISWRKYTYNESYGYYEWIEVPGETGSQLTVSDLNNRSQYMCIVTDSYGNSIEHYYSFYVSTGLTFVIYDGDHGSYTQTSYNDNIYLAPGTSTTLNLPEIQICDGVNYTITWNWWNNSGSGTIETAANSTSCTTLEVSEYTTYQAVIIDDYGFNMYANYNLHPESGLTFVVETEGPGGSDTYTTSNYNNNINITTGTSITLELPEIQINDGLNYTISWEYCINSPNNNWVSLEYETSSITTITITEDTTYHAYVRDSYGNTIEAWFYVHPESGLGFLFYSEGPGGTYSYTQTGYSSDVYVDYNSTTTLKLPQIQINEGLNYTITWDWWNDNNSGTIAEASNSTSCTTLGITENTNYCATVRDEYGNSISAYYYLHINTGLAWANYDGKWYSRRIPIQPGYCATLAIPEIVINDGYNYQISWNCYGNDDIPSGTVEEAADSRSYTTPVLTKAIQYYVTVTDDQNNSINAEFYIYIDSGLSWNSSRWNYITVKYGDDYTLTVPSFNIAEGLTPVYSWSSEGGTIEGETSATLSLTNITNNTWYCCDVSDGYTAISCEFDITVNTGLMWKDGSTYNSQTLSYDIGGQPFTIEMPEYDVNDNLKSDITIKWYKSEKKLTSGGQWSYEAEEEITANTDNSITVSDLQVNTIYIVKVSDPCGNTIRTNYTINVNSGLSWADGTTGDYKYYSTSVPVGESCVVNAPAVALNSSISAENLTYVWYLRERYTEESGYSYYRTVRQTEVAGDTLNLSNIQTLTSGYVYISDPYGNELQYNFTIAVASGLAWKDGSTNGSTYVEVPYGASFDMWVPEFTVNDGVDYTIRIEGLFSNGHEERIISSDEVITSAPITGIYSYYIRITDQYDNNIYFNIYCRNNYSLTWANGNIYYMQNVDVDNLSDTVVLQLPEYIYDGGEDLTITWTGADGIVSLDQKTCTIEGLEEPDIVYARVNDRTSNSAIVAAFNIGLSSQLSFADGSDQVLIRLSAGEGEEITLNLPEINSEGELTYQWLRMSKNYAGGSKKGNLGNEDTYVVANAAFTDYYYTCVITDEAGHRIRALYDILAPAHEFDAHGVSIQTGKYEAQTQYVSITLDGQIGLNFYTAVDQSVVDDGAYAVLSHGNDSETISLSDAIKGSLSSQSVYKLTYHVDAKAINDLVSISIYDKFGRLIKMHNASGEEIESYSFSVAQYLTRAGDTNVSYFADLVNSMSAYGNLAGKYFGTVNNYPVGEDTAAALAACTADTVQEYAAEESGAIPAGITYYGSSLVLDSDTNIYHYFKLLDGASIDDYQFLVDGSPVTPVTSGNFYRVEINNIPAADLGKTFETVVAFAGSTSGYTINYSAYSYVYAALEAYSDSTHADLLNAVKALYMYGNSANSYFVFRQKGGKL